MTDIPGNVKSPNGFDEDLALFVRNIVFSRDSFLHITSDNSGVYIGLNKSMGRYPLGVHFVKGASEEIFKGIHPNDIDGVARKLEQIAGEAIYQDPRNNIYAYRLKPQQS